MFADAVDGFANNIEQAAAYDVAGGHRDRATRIDAFHAAHQTVGGVHSDRTNAVFAEVALNFQYKFGTVGTGDFQCAENFRQFAVRTAEVNVHNSADDLFNTTDISHRTK